MSSVNNNFQSEDGVASKRLSIGIPRFLRAPPHKPRLPDETVNRLYPKFRWQILEATFMGYGLFYVVRNNLAVVAKDMDVALGYTHGEIGLITAFTALAYGIGKFLWGSVSDRSNVRRFMPLGLLLTAMCNFAFGSIISFPMHLALWTMNGFVQGMGWPPCGRSMGHWFSVRERGLTFSIWNTSHNVGGGLAGIVTAWAVITFGGWEYAFYVPGVIATIGAVYLYIRLRDTPQSEGLPSIEEYKNDFTKYEREHGTAEQELSTKELFLNHVLFNKYIWILALANCFAYITRYGMMDWAPMYLREVKNATLAEGGFSIFVQEFGGIPSTIFFGWVSDRLKGRRGMIALLCMVPIVMAYIGLMLNPVGNLWIDMILLATIGCFIYPVINLLTIMALDITSKKAIGTAAGFIGLFGYLGRAAQAVGFGGFVGYYSIEHGKTAAWDLVLLMIAGAGVLCIGLLAFVWNTRPKN